MVALAAFVRAPVVVTVPEPIWRRLLFWSVDEKSMLPEFDPMLPVDETAPVNVRVPEVEVTVPATSHEGPVTVIVVVPAERVHPVVVELS